MNHVRTVFEVEVRAGLEDWQGLEASVKVARKELNICPREDQLMHCVRQELQGWDSDLNTCEAVADIVVCDGATVILFEAYKDNTASCWGTSTRYSSCVNLFQDPKTDR
jgi:hypothetical protein